MSHRTPTIFSKMAEADASEKDGKLSGAESDQDALANGLMQIFRPAVEELDDKVISVRYYKCY